MENGASVLCCRSSCSDPRWLQPPPSVTGTRSSSPSSIWIDNGTERQAPSSHPHHVRSSSGAHFTIILSGRLSNRLMQVSFHFFHRCIMSKTGHCAARKHLRCSDCQKVFLSCAIVDQFLRPVTIHTLFVCHFTQPHPPRFKDLGVKES